MDPRATRILITILVLVAGVSIVALMLTSGGQQQQAPTPATQPETPAATTPADEQDDADDGAPDDEQLADTDAKPTDSIRGSDNDASPPPEPEPTTESDAADAESIEPVDVSQLFARAPLDRSLDPAIADTLGSFDPEQHRFKVEFTSVGAGIERIVFSEIWVHALHRAQAQEHGDAIAAGNPDPPTMPDDDRRLTLVRAQPIRQAEGTTPQPLPVLAVREIVVNGTRVHLYDFHRTHEGERVPVWGRTAPGTYETYVVDGAGEEILHIVRTWSIRNNSYDLQLRQTVTNLTEQPIDVTWEQYGPPEVSIDTAPHRATYVDTRRFRFGYLLSPQQDPQRLAEVIADEMLFEWKSVLEREDEHGVSDPLWPNQDSLAEGFELSWFASTSRYFAVAVHPWWPGEGTVNRSLADTVRIVNHQHWPIDNPNNKFFISTLLTSPARTIAPGETSDFSMGVYAGPMARDILYEREPYKTLNLGGLIFYQISTWCAFCTFQWLAHWLIWFLDFVHAATFDWAVAIIILVLTVRLILHPITKRAQVSMHRTMKRMAKFKPEMEKLQKKYANDKKKLQTEQIRLMREHGVNPLGCLGFVPMLLQMPIWVALYAMLFFAYELRHEPAFWGFFQMFGNWQFLADLSAPDHFLGELSKPFTVLWMPITGFNLLPFLMGAVFFVQQKYMTPPTAATLSKEQQQQQKIMRVLMIVLFPIMLYSAPSGLTLYIMTSSTVGIIESRMIRRHAEHLEEMAEEQGKDGDNTLGPPWSDKGKKRKPRDPRGRAYAQMLERMREGKKKPQRSFKKRR